MDLLATIHAVQPLMQDVLESPWLLPALAGLIALDGPMPMLPSETVLMSAAAAAFGAHSAAGVAGLFAAAFTGAVLGDLAVFGLGRSSNRVLPRSAHAESGLAAWVRANMFRRPVVALVGARFVPGGRLISCAAAGRLGLPLPRLLAGSAVSAVLWSVYMLVIGFAVGPVVGGNPLMCVVAGIVMAVVTAGIYAVGARVRRVVLLRRRVRERAARYEPAFAAR